MWESHDTLQQFLVMSKEVQKEIEALKEVTSAFMKSQVLLVANQYDLFTRIDGRKMTAEKIAALLGTDHRATRMMLDALAGMNYLEKRDGKYQNTEVSKRLLVGGSPYYQGDSLRHRYRLWYSWSALRDVLRTGVPPEETSIAYSVSEKEHTRNYILAMANNSRVKADRLSGALDLTGVKVLLDLGGGPGTYAVALARRYPELRAVVYDLPEVCSIAEEQIARAGLSDRVTTQPGDFLTDELGSGYDVILVSNIIHIYATAEGRHILSKCFAALSPGGRVVVNDLFLDEDRSGPLLSLLFAINMLVRTKAGDAYTFGQVEEMLTEAGFTELQRLRFAEQFWVIQGHKERSG